MTAFTDDQLRNIQGFGVAGFRKDHQEVLFIRFGEVAGAKRLLGWLSPRIADAWEVSRFNEVFSAVRQRTGEELLEATWVAAMLSASGLEFIGQPLTSLPPGEGTTAFAAGMAARSGQIGDTRPADAPSGWVEAFRQPGGVHLAVVVASDDPEDLDRLSEAVAEQVSRCAAQVVFQERGGTLPGDLRGHEHFGFRDGVSQPDIDGWDDPPQDGAPPAVPAGEFVFGYPDAAQAAPTTDPMLVDSSMVVFRRLNQDVAAFRAQAAAGVSGSSPAIPADKLAAKMVGRWPSGAPLDSHPDVDPGPGFDTNNFSYADDADGQQCPRWAHIRKSNPRQEATPDPGNDDPRRHRMLRRGIPFGPPYEGAASPDDTERGLHFFSVVTDVARQFEFVQRQWLNEPNFPGGAVSSTPGEYGPPSQGAPDGPDPIAGQHDDTGAQCSLRQAAGPINFPLTTQPVRATAGEYFWLPSRAAIARITTAPSPA